MEEMVAKRIGRRKAVLVLFNVEGGSAAEELVFGSWMLCRKTEGKKRG